MFLPLEPHRSQFYRGCHQQPAARHARPLSVAITLKSMCVCVCACHFLHQQVTVLDVIDNLPQDMHGRCPELTPYKVGHGIMRGICKRKRIALQRVQTSVLSSSTPARLLFALLLVCLSSLLASTLDQKHMHVLSTHMQLVGSGWVLQR